MRLKFALATDPIGYSSYVYSGHGSHWLEFLWFKFLKVIYFDGVDVIHASIRYKNIRQICMRI